MPQSPRGRLDEALRKGDDETAAGLVRSWTGSPWPIALHTIAERNMTLAFRAYMARWPNRCTWDVAHSAACCGSWAVLEELSAWRRPGTVPMPGGKIPTRVVRAALMRGAEKWKRELLGSSLLNRDWRSAALLVSNMSVEIGGPGQGIDPTMLVDAPLWFLKHVLETVPLDAGTTLFLGNRVCDRPAYLELLKQRGFDLNAHFVWGRLFLPSAEMYVVYSADYAETALLRALRANNAWGAAYLRRRGAVGLA